MVNHESELDVQCHRRKIYYGYYQQDANMRELLMIISWPMIMITIKYCKCMQACSLSLSVLLLVARTSYMK